MITIIATEPRISGNSNKYITGLNNSWCKFRSSIQTLEVFDVADIFSFLKYIAKLFAHSKRMMMGLHASFLCNWCAITDTHDCIAVCLWLTMKCAWHTHHAYFSFIGLNVVQKRQERDQFFVIVGRLLWSENWWSVYFRRYIFWSW